MQRAPKKDNTKLYYSNPKSREVLKQKVRQVFNLFDTDGSGEIDSKEFHDLLYSMGKIMTDEDVAKYLAVLDRDGNGSISFDEFFDWWCTRDNSGDNKDHSNDKLKEVKAKLQSRSLMRSISYLINKAKKDVEEEKEKNKNNINTIENASTKAVGQDPNTFVVDTKVKIGDLQSENAKATIRLSYMTMDTPALLLRVEYKLINGTTDQDADKIKQLFVAFNNITGGKLFTSVSMNLSDRDNSRYATVELALSNAGSANTTIRDIDLKKLLFSIESSQRLEDLDLSTLALNISFHLEASRVALVLLPPTANLSPIHTGLFSMMQYAALEIAFKNVNEVVNGAFNYARFFEGLAAMKLQAARQFRQTFRPFGVDLNLPISELTQTMVQIERDALVCDMTGIDQSFLFKEVADGSVPQALVDLPQSDVQTPAPIPVLAPETVPYMNRYIDVVDITDPSDPDQKETYGALGNDHKLYTAKKVDEKTGKHIPVVVDKIHRTEVTSQQQEFDMWQKLVGLPYVYDYADVHYEGEYMYTAITNYGAIGYEPLPLFLAKKREENPAFEQFEPIAKMVAQKMLNACLIFSKNYVTHSVAIDFMIHPLTLDMRLCTLSNFRELPVKQMPETLPQMCLPPELFTVEGSTNYGAAVDVWMYGVFCYAVCTNVFVYEVNFETGEGVENITSGNWNNYSPHFTSLPETVRNFLTRILSKDLAARPTFNELAADPWFHN